MKHDITDLLARVGRDLDRVKELIVYSPIDIAGLA